MGIRQTRLLSNDPSTGLPVESLAGVNLEREIIRRQVATSSADDPLEAVTTQSVTRPLGATFNRKSTRPSSPAAKADAG